MKTDYAKVGVILILTCLAGWISISNWEFVVLIAVVINQLLTYDDAKLIYTTKVLKHRKKEIDDVESKSNFVFYKLLFNVSIVISYFLIATTDNIKMLESLYLRLNKDVETLPNIITVMFKGLDRLLLIVLLAKGVKLLTKCKFFEELQCSVKNKFEALFVSESRKR